MRSLSHWLLAGSLLVAPAITVSMPVVATESVVNAELVQISSVQFKWVLDDWDKSKERSLLTLTIRNNMDIDIVSLVGILTIKDANNQVVLETRGLIKSDVIKAHSTGESTVTTSYLEGIDKVPKTGAQADFKLLGVYDAQDKLVAGFGQ